MKGQNKKILAGLALLLLLAVAFWYGGNTPASHGWSAGSSVPQQSQSVEPAVEEESAETAEPQQLPIRSSRKTPEHYRRRQPNSSQQLRQSRRQRSLIRQHRHRLQQTQSRQRPQLDLPAPSPYPAVCC